MRYFMPSALALAFLSSHIYLWHSPTSLFTLLFYLFDILPFILLLVSPLPPFLPWLNLNMFLFPVSFSVSHALRGSSVTVISLRGRMSFHRGTGGDIGGASSWHARVLVNRTMWLYSKERPYWRRNSEELPCVAAYGQTHRKKTSMHEYLKI